MTKTHWLHGSGPNNEIKFNKEVDTETNCFSCLHKKVCSYAFDKRCSNFEFGNSDGIQNNPLICHNCIHKYTRFDNRQPITCFHCKDYLPDNIIVEFLNNVKSHLFISHNITLKTTSEEELIFWSIYDFKKENNIEEPFENPLCLDIMRVYVIKSVVEMIEKRKKGK